MRFQLIYDNTFSDCGMKKKKAFTLVEMLAVIVILGVIMAIGVFSVNSYIEKSKKELLKGNN